MKNNKGAVWTIVVIALVAVVVVALIAFGGLGFGGGAGDGEGDGNISNADDTEPEETLPVIEEIEYVEITVSGKDYLYNNAKYTLEELIEELKKENLEVPVKITDDRSSLKAYSGLKEVLSESNIRYIEAQ